MQIKSEDRTDVAKKELDHAFGALKVALHILHPIVSAKPLFESGQTLLVVTRDKKDTDQDYFEPHNFLVRLRLAALPLLRSLWEAPWLVHAPPSVIKSVVRTVLEVCLGDNEEPRGELESGITNGPVGSGSTSSTRLAGPDEDRIRQLTDMGFPRSAVERALTRTHNNVNAATELLLAHPFPLPPDPEPIQPEPVPEAPSVEEPEPTVTNPDVDITSSASEVAGDDADPLQEATASSNSESWRKALNEAREPLRAGISRQALSLVDHHLGLIFDLHGAWVQRSSVHHEQTVRNLVDDVKVFTHDRRDQPLANRFRILALILLEVPTTVNQELRDALMEYLMANLDLFPIGAETGNLAVPKWLATHFLVTEALLTLGNQVRQIMVPKEGEPIVSEAIIAGPLYPEARAKSFDYCLRLLAIENLSRDELLSVLRLLVLLTRDHQLACQFVKRGGIGFIFRRLKSSSVTGCQGYIAIILRHVVEDSGILSSLIRQAIKRYLAQPRTRVVDVGTFVRNCSAMALRDPEIFVQVTQSLCQLDRPFSPSAHISLKPEMVDTDPKDIPHPEDTDMQVDAPVSSPPPANQSETAALQKECLDCVVHFLLGELMKVSRITISPHAAESLPAVSRDPTTSRSITGTSRDHLLGPDSEEDGADPKPRDPYPYLCFVMQCLTELLFSYDTCRTSFLSFSPKRRLQTSVKDASNKHKTAALQFLLSDLITFGTINPQPGQEAQNRIAICNWAMSVIVALCVDTSVNEGKDTPPELASIRKLVLEAISRSIKDLPSSENLEARYGRLLALTDLCNRLLTVRFNVTFRKEDIPTHMAKIMLEKHFVATLTNALSEVDLNYPNARVVVASILRPLEHLYVVSFVLEAQNLLLYKDPR